MSKVLLLCCSVLLMSWPVRADTPPTLDDGIRQVREGELADAVVTLDAVILRLKAEVAPDRKQVGRAFLYKGTALVGLAQEQPARASFKLAQAWDPEIRVEKTEFSPRVIRVFDAARKDKSKPALYDTGSGTTKKAGIGALGIGAIVAGVLAAGGAAAVAAGGGGDSSSSQAGGTGDSQSSANRPPTNVTIDLGFGSGEGDQAIVGVTTVALTGNASDPDGDSLSYAWSLDDGTALTGKVVSHVFQRSSAGVTLTVTDGRGGSQGANANVRLGNLSGNWHFVGRDDSINIDQAGTSLIIQYRPPPRSGIAGGSGTGTASDPRDLQFFFNYEGPGPAAGYSYNLTANGSLDRLQGVELGTGTNRSNTQITLTR